MKEDGQLEELLHRHRGTGLVLLCALMIVIGSLQMDKRTVETGSREVVKESSDIAAGTKIGETASRLSGIVPADGRKAQAILEILKKHHTDLQLILKEEDKEGRCVKWYIECRE